MAVWGKRVLWGVVLMLTGAAGQSVNYPPPVCAVTGSTVILPCTFTLNHTLEKGRVQIKVVRVRWCQNHLICHKTTPSVYDSQSPNTNTRYKYLGDMTGNCTLQITDVNRKDGATLRFRTEVNHTEGHFTGTSGVSVSVVDATPMGINSSSDDRTMTVGDIITLHCTTICTFHQLEVTWSKNGHALLESGPALQIGPLTAEDSGNYTCALKTKAGTESRPYRLTVEEEQEETGSGTDDKLLVVRVVLFTLHTVLIIIVASVVIRRTFFDKAAAEAEV